MWEPLLLVCTWLNPFGEGFALVFLDGGVHGQGQCPELVVVCAWGVVVVDLAVWHELVGGGV